MPYEQINFDQSHDISHKAHGDHRVDKESSTVLQKHAIPAKVTHIFLFKSLPELCGQRGHTEDGVKEKLEQKHCITIENRN